MIVSELENSLPLSPLRGLLVLVSEEVAEHREPSQIKVPLHDRDFKDLQGEVISLVGVNDIHTQYVLVELERSLGILDTDHGATNGNKG